jgi:hypothetical protein
MILSKLWFGTIVVSGFLENTYDKMLMLSPGGRKVEELNMSLTQSNASNISVSKIACL